MVKLWDRQWKGFIPVAEFSGKKIYRFFLIQYPNTHSQPSTHTGQYLHSWVRALGTSQHDRKCLLIMSGGVLAVHGLFRPHPSKCIGNALPVLVKTKSAPLTPPRGFLLQVSESLLDVNGRCFHSYPEGPLWVFQPWFWNWHCIKSTGSESVDKEDPLYSHILRT